MKNNRHGKYDGSFMRGLNNLWDITVIVICGITLFAIFKSIF